MIFSWGEDPAPRRRKIPKAVHDMVWKKYMKDKTEGKCYCCQLETISFFNFEVGHNKAVATGGKDHIDNLRPICKSCNVSMGTKTIESFRAKHFVKPKPGTLNPVQAKAQLKRKLEDLTVPQLKLLASKHKVRVQGRVEQSLFFTETKAPTKGDYIKKLSTVVTDADLRSPSKAAPKPRGRR